MTDRYRWALLLFLQSWTAAETVSAVLQYANNYPETWVYT